MNKNQPVLMFLGRSALLRYHHLFLSPHGRDRSALVVSKAWEGSHDAANHHNRGMRNSSSWS